MLRERNGLNSSTSDVQAKVKSTLAFCGLGGNQDKIIGDGGDSLTGAGRPLARRTTSAASVQRSLAPL